MRHPWPSRCLSACALLLLIAGAGASASSGAPVLGPHAVELKLLAHDTSRSLGRLVHPLAQPHVTPRKAFSGPLVLRTPLSVLVPQAKAILRRALAPVTSLAIDGNPQSGGIVPSDANGDIGRTQYVQAVNHTYGIYSRTGALLARVGSSAFWSGLGGPDAAGLCASNPGGDPSVAYDHAADRWVVSEFAFAAGSGGPLSPFVECVAVSTSPDATGTWNRYAFQVSTALFPDYPKLAIWSDGYYLSFNQFTSVGGWGGAGAMALERSKMLLGQSAQARYFDLGGVNPKLGGMLAANIESVGAPAPGAPELYLQAHDDPTNVNDRLEVWAFHVDWSAPVTGSTFQPVASLPVQAFDSTFLGCGATNNQCMRQFGSAQKLDPVSSVYASATEVLPQLMFRLQYNRSAGGVETLTASDTVNAGFGAGLRWYELWNSSGAGWTIHAQGTYAPNDGNDRFLPSIAFDNGGELGLAYSISGTVSPSLAYTGRVPADAPGAMSIVETFLVAGAGAQSNSDRWGDYSSLSLDPIDGCNFWFTGQYENGGSWQSRIGAFNFTTCTPFASQPPTLTVDPTWSAPLVREGVTITGSAPTFTGALSVSYQWRRCDSFGLNCVDIAGATGLTHLMTAGDAAGDRTLRLQATASNASGTSVAVSTATSVVQSLPPTNVTRPVIFGTPQAGQVLGVTTGTWISSSPLNYTYRWRSCAGGTCLNIPGANGPSYTPTAADVGATLDAVVGATNTGGGTDANASATATVAAAAAGGSSGSGSSATPDLAVAVFAAPTPTTLGATLNYFVTVTNKTTGDASGVNVDLSLPGGVTFIAASSDRGSACTLSGSVVHCPLGSLQGSGISIVTISVRVGAAGVLSATATVSAAVDSNSSNNSASSAVTAANTTGTVPRGLNDFAAGTSAGADRKVPTTKALRSGGRHGATAKLRFKIYDDGGSAKARVTVRRNGRTIGAANTGFGPVAFGGTYYVGWHVPANAAQGRYSFCVTALDRAGNKSASSCAPLALR